MMDKKWNVPQEEFLAMLQEYTAQDYIKGIPYQYLVRLMECDFDRYRSYTKFLTHDAISKGLAWKDCVQIQMDILSRIEKTQAVLGLINEALEHRIPEDKVGVLPIMCGNGKSSAISQKILEVIKANDGRGMIIVTDSVDRLNEYVCPAYNEILQAYFAEHEQQITLMYTDTLLEANCKQQSTPVLLMTTQRYFSLTPEEIKAYTKWDGGLRDTILIDERPPLREVVHVSRGDIHTVASALVDGIGNEADQNEKQWCLQEWLKVQTRIHAVCDGFENRYPEKKKSYFFYTNPEKRVTEDDERFLRFVSDNRSSLKRYKDGAAYKTLKAVFIIEREGAVFQSQKGAYYNNTFSVLIDNREMLTSIGAKVLILDGTACFHPDYKQEYLYQPELLEYEYRHYVHNLESLRICFVDIPTSKTHIVNGDRNHEIKKAIMNYLEGIQRDHWYAIEPDGSIRMVGDTTPYDPKKWPIFTYKALEDYFRRHGYENIDHFGNLRGRNDYRDFDTLVQIGLHRFAPLHYLTYKLYSAEGMIEQFRHMTEQQCSEMIERIVEDPQSCADIMYPMILEDIEQNFFRGAVRKNERELAQNKIRSAYWVFCNTKTNKPLIELAAKRYNNLDAEVQVIDNPPQKMHAKAMARNGKRPSAYQAVCHWLDAAQKGKVFKRADILKEAGISVKAFEEMLRKHPEMKKRLEEMTIRGKKRVYQKN